MPKNETDPDDPMELRGVGLITEEDTSELMAECFIEEFMRLGHGATRILALFRNPHYTGVNLVLRNRGEQFVRDKIVEVFGWWKQPLDFSAPSMRPASTSPAAGDDDGATATGTVRPVRQPAPRAAPAHGPPENVLPKPKGRSKHPHRIQP